MGSTSSHLDEMRRLRERCAALEQELDVLRHRQQKRLDIADQVHRSLLPTPIRHDRIWVDMRYVPLEEIGGDYCQVRFPDSATCYITICDIMGHGTASALLATRISSACSVRYPVPDGARRSGAVLAAVHGRAFRAGGAFSNILRRSNRLRPPRDHLERRGASRPVAAEPAGKRAAVDQPKSAAGARSA